MPGVIATHQKSNSTTTTLAIPAAGAVEELVVVKVMLQAGTVTCSGGTGLTWTLRASGTAASKNPTFIYTTVRPAGHAAFTLTVAGGTNPRTFFVERFSDAVLDATPAISSPQVGTPTPGQPLATIVTEGPNSIVTWCSSDWAENAVGTAAYRSGATAEYAYLATGSHGGYYARQTTGAAGSYTIGLTAPASQDWQMVGLEIKHAAFAPTVDAGADVVSHTVNTQFTRTATVDDGGSAITSEGWEVTAGPGTAATPASVLNIGSGSGQNHFELQIAPDIAQPIEVKTMAELIAGYSLSPNFMLSNSDATTHFQVRVDGLTTAGSSFARCELREVDINGDDYAFNAAVGEHYLAGTTTITNLPAVKPDMVIAQMHDGNNDVVSIRTQLVSGTIRLRVRINGTSVTSPQMASPYVLGTEFNWKIRMIDGGLEVYWAFGAALPGTPQITSAAIVATSPASHYFKAGSYLQSNTTNDAGSEIGASDLKNLEHWHTGWPTPVPGSGGGSTVGPIGSNRALAWTPTIVGSYTLDFTATNAVGSDVDSMTIVVVDPPPAADAMFAGLLEMVMF
jgi:hypothetical protein